VRLVQWINYDLSMHQPVGDYTALNRLLFDWVTISYLTLAQVLSNRLHFWSGSLCRCHGDTWYRHLMVCGDTRMSVTTMSSTNSRHPLHDHLWPYRRQHTHHGHISHQLCPPGGTSLCYQWCQLVDTILLKCEFRSTQTNLCRLNLRSSF